jgi:hypothetical protein
MSSDGQAPHDQPMIDATALVGLRISLDRTIDVCCGACGQTIVTIKNGAGPHVASLHCASCDRHRGWLPKAVADFLLEMISRFGRPTDVITIRNSRVPTGCRRRRAESDETSLPQQQGVPNDNLTERGRGAP